MTLRLDWLRRIYPRTKVSFLPLPFAIALFVFVGCSKKEAEVVPEVSVQVTAAKTGDVSRIVTAEAADFPTANAFQPRSPNDPNDPKMELASSIARPSRNALGVVTSNCERR